ncbi:amino acid ABC transporter substrate-binding protein [Nocardioides terrisoli]|uniref:amino acid ABC transporter substrate-binding protein n=1 Tax=Nocardioides terrisoli TaxID=3388267 RepID=UPI00287B7A37|nr:amino acid ABC transporter substrate-binding protein [Nocardioides marmorisolisilvae]
MNGIIKGIAALCCGATLAAASAGCSTKGASDSSDSVAVGVALPLSGALASSGQTMLRGYRLAISSLNAAGGVDGKKVKLVVEDDKFDPATGQSAIKKLVTQDHVKAILGTYGSAPALAESQVAERYKVPNIQPEASDGTMVTRGYKYLFNTFRLIDETEVHFIDFLKQVVKPKSAAIVYINNSFATDGANKFASLAADAGIKLVKSVSVESGASNFTAALSKVKSADPDVLQFIGYVPDEIVFLKGLRTLNFAPRVVFTQSGVAFDPSVRDALGNGQDGVTGMPDWFPGSPFPSANKVADEYQKKYGQPAREEVIKAYQAAQILLAAIKQTKGGSSQAITDAIRKTDMDVVGGHVTFAANGQASIGAVIAQQLGSSARAIYPEDVAQASWKPFPAWSDR